MGKKEFSGSQYCSILIEENMLPKVFENGECLNVLRLVPKKKRKKRKEENYISEMIFK